MKTTLYGFFLTLVIVLSGCSQTEIDRIEPEPPAPSEQEEMDQASEEEITSDHDEKPEEQILTLEETADTIVHLLKDHDMKGVADFIHPTDGVRFSPYGYIDVDNDQVFSAEEVKNLWEDETVYHWGSLDGTGEPIDKTFPEYYERFVYDEDYANAEETAVDERLGHGNTLDNTKEVYPSASVVEFHFSGFEEQYEGMDWRSLRLVLKEEDDKWYLVSIIHDEWTT
ncbi:hypothetical protein [Halalkalibacter alkalisediminis]|uniref:Uncharacterized protein n=1 Tax=Halalkalibacter alkalisediminis TaxID=935616 RepID=A0ABV6NF26_9BACI|nr:hypothetical protein [Halalkalibacter alkalisediminis]